VEDLLEKVNVRQLRSFDFNYLPAGLIGLPRASNRATVGAGYQQKERGATHMTYQTDEFHPHAAKRLFLAVVNQAISDVLEKNEEAKAAEQWLLSEEFDNFAELLSWDAEGFHQQQSVA
jgi:hypothetical protein